MFISTIISLSIVILVLSFLLFFKKSTLPKDILEFNADLFIAKIAEKTIESQNNNTQKLIDRFNQLQKEISENLYINNERSIKSLNFFKDELSKSLRIDFNEIRRLMDEKLKDINEKVNENITSNFKKTEDTFQKIIERIAKIDEAQRKMEDLSKNVISLQNVLTDKKSRGSLGEVQLKQILTSAFGEKNDKLYQMQYTINYNSKQVRVDSVIFFPEPTGMLCIDSKFPLENYQRMLEANTPLEKEQFSKIFKQDVKKHIDDISEKYIIENVTAENAILFIPAEAIFAEIHAYHPDIIDYSYKKKVFIVSPTTLLAVCNTVQVAIKDIEINKYAKEVKEHLVMLSKEFERYQGRWSTLSRDIEKVSRDTKEIEITSQKIANRFNTISSGKIQEIESQNSTITPIKETEQKNLI